MKAAGRNPELSRTYTTYRAAGRPKKRRKDEANDFPRLERTEDERSNVERNNVEWIKTAKDKKKEEQGKQVRDGGSSSQHRAPTWKDNG